MSDVAAVADANPKKSRTLLAILLLVMALVLFGAAFAWAGGLDYVSGMLGGDKIAANRSPAPAAAAPAPVVDESEFGKRLYVEQLESAENIRLLSDGRLSSISVSKVSVEGDVAIIDMTAQFSDKSQVGGEVVMGRSAGKWYFLALSGLRTAEVNDLSRFTRAGTSLEDTHTAEEGLSALGMTTFDDAVLATLIEQQSANQKLAQGIVDGTYTALRFGTPERGAGTISIPVTLSTKDSTGQGTLVLVTKQIDGKDRTFLASLKEL